MIASRRIRTSLQMTCLAAWAAAASSPLSVSAATRTVTNLNDSGAGSLRDAVTQSNANADFDRIVFNSSLTGTITFSSTINITTDMSIEGPGPRVISFSGGNSQRLFSVSSPTSTSFSGVRFANGFSDRGAAITFNSVSGLLEVADSHFDQNTVTIDGGAICLLAGSLTAKRCTFTTDQAAGSGGCIWWGQGGGTPTVEIANCTFVNNFASNSGGALRQFSTTSYASKLTNCTMVVNNAGSAGGAIALNAGTMSIHNMLLAANNAGGNPGGHIRTAGGTLTSLGNNLIGHIDGATFTAAAGDRFGTVASQLNTGVLIAFPFNNGGLTDTLPFSANSIAIDAGSADSAAPGDQRNFPRVGCAPDVGAFESQTPLDTDGDGVINCLDQCPSTPACASVDEKGCPTDSDSDGVADGCDLCPATRAGEAVNASGCSTIDEDGDGVLNDVDQCRGTPACAKASVNSVGCPTDADADGLFDGCDRCPGSNDLTDSDGDGIPDCLDACPNATDGDGDGVQDCQDNCPGNALKVAPGACGCNQADTDADGDGVADCQDGCPNDALKRDPGVCGCNHADTDVDGDGIADCADQCANTPSCAVVNQNGCPIDSDADGVSDGCDRCPGSIAGDAVDANGCSLVDEDSDRVLNDVDRCRGTPACARASVDSSGCPVDSDGDGIWNGCDACSGTNDRQDADGDKTPDCFDPCPSVGDTDGDGVQDCQDGCPSDPRKRDPGACGCGQPDSDANGNGFPDCLDAAVAQAAGQTTPTVNAGTAAGAAPMCGAGVVSTATVMTSLFFLMTGRRRVSRQRRE